MSVIFLIILAVVFFVLQQYSKRHCLDGLRYDYYFGKHLVECGEKFELTTTLENEKNLPAFFVKLSEMIPNILEVETEGTGVRRRDYKGSMGMDISLLEQVLYLMPRQRVQRCLKVSLPKRGRYQFQGGTLLGGDLLGLEEETRRETLYREIVVIPKQADIPELDQAFGNFMGNLSVRRWILSDPILTVGFREYTGREPMRDISWPRSLREGQLMVKQYDYTAEMTATVILQFHSSKTELEELLYSQTRSVCELLEDKHISYSFATNLMMISSGGRWSYLSDGLGNAHLYTILEGLGGADGRSFRSLEEVLNQVWNENDQSRGYIILTTSLTESEERLLSDLQRRTGAGILVISSEGGASICG